MLSAQIKLSPSLPDAETGVSRCAYCSQPLAVFIAPEEDGMADSGEDGGGGDGKPSNPFKMPSDEEIFSVATLALARRAARCS